MSGRTIALILVVGLAVLIGAWFLATHDRVTRTEWVGPSGEARMNDFLAAERFAERMGFKVSEVRALPDLDALSASGRLLVPNRRQELSPQKLAELVRWVESGGHMIVEAEPLAVPDPLLDQLAVRRSAVEPARKPLVVQVPGASRRLQVYFGDAMRLETAQAEVHVRAGAHLVSFARGRGMVTVASSLRFARNPGYDDYFARIGQRPERSIRAFDHAEFFLHLISLTPGVELVVYFRPERLSLWGFLKEHALPALAAFGLLLALWLWSIIPRFGPVAPDAPPGRRRLLDHLRASGRYYWVKGLRSRLVVAARDAALRRIARAQPDFANAPQSERIARLSSMAGISREDAARFISAAGAMRGADFIRTTQHAQRVHSALDKGIKR
ncbi:MAG TPA: DUF4350 domain-containing protein [Burkholderiales bacterium]|nr:DUF4350 domain-containing protein [Burkholderiales bacterium]